jgi:hypothetical protein
MIEEISTFRELQTWLDSGVEKYRHTKTSDATIRFDLPDTTTGKAVFSVYLGEQELARIRVFFWSELTSIRELVRFGSNYRQEPCGIHSLLLTITTTMYEVRDAIQR